MSSDIKPESELFLDLSEPQQENISGGRSRYSGFSPYNFYLQKTIIETFANSAINVSGSNGGISSVQQTGYKFSQINMGFNLGFGGGRRRSSRRYGLFDMLFSLMSLFD